MRQRRVIVSVELFSVQSATYLKKWYTMRCPYPDLVVQVQTNVVKEKENRTKTKKEK